MTLETTGDILREMQHQLAKLRSDFIIMDRKLTKLISEISGPPPQSIQLIKPEGLTVPDFVCFTERELELVDLLRHGLGNKNIAYQLGITQHTVNKEPRWRHGRSELTTGYQPAHYGNR